MEENTDNQIEEFKMQLNHLSETGYDVEKYTRSLLHQTSQLEYFYCHIVKDGDIDHAYYKVRDRPKEHQLAYFNIGRGYPKELMDGHFCYIVKDLGLKILIIPSTSIKEDSAPLDERYEKDIVITDHKKIYKSRLQLTDMRMVDIQRLDDRKPYYEVMTDRNEIMHFISDRLFTN